MTDHRDIDREGGPVAYPTVSIGMPVHNGERFLRETLDCLLGQTFTDLELVISDNASTDATPDICFAYAALDPRIRYYRNERNLGAAYNYSNAFRLSRGTYFKWAAADDLCGDDYVEKCVATLEERLDAAVCYGRTHIIDEHGTVLRPYEDSRYPQSPDPIVRFQSSIFTGKECNAVFGLIRASALAKTGLIGNYPSSDAILLGELNLHGTFVQRDDCDFFRREHPAASSADRSTGAQQEFFDPATTGRVFMRTWRHHYEYVAAVGRAPLSWRDKAVLWRQLLHRAARHRIDLKWELGQVMRQFARRT